MFVNVFIVMYFNLFVLIYSHARSPDRTEGQDILYINAYINKLNYTCQNNVFEKTKSLVDLNTRSVPLIV